ncbi:ATP-dependent helicase [Pedobacter steynii]|uniref:DNA 3'-5' helicase n=1 Tax=Pedobacter steynii TaxID=430522 RepID=A0A1D7QLD2_9SPHI|nr:ATP-dependent helicase [Pedobacter steynii]AOM79488.1 DNA helicase UvrD [Pedobacter steynii]
MPLKPIVLVGEQKRVLFLQVTEPIQIKGVAGSGKTTVALYRAKHLLDTQSNLFQDSKVAIFTYNKTLVKYINSITPFISGGYRLDSEIIVPRKPIGMNVFVTSFHKWAFAFIKENGNNLYGRTIMGNNQISWIERSRLKFSASDASILKKSADFFSEEISWIKGKALITKEEYFDAKRVGRGTNDRVTRTDKETIWKIYLDYNAAIKASNFVDFDDYALLCLEIIDNTADMLKPFTHIIVDEAQDLSKAQISVISKIVSENTKSISIIADAAQRIYKSGFTWGEVGINVRGGRTVEFKTNYRNTIPIAKAAMSLLSNETETDEFTEIKPARRDGQKPIIGRFDDEEDQFSYLLLELNALKNNEQLYSTVILHRNHVGISKIIDFLDENNFDHQELQKTDDIDFENDSIKVCTLSSVKGLEFENVFLVDLNDNVIPYPPGFSDIDDEYHISTERRLLYTSMTRARERLYLLSFGNPSRYLSEIDTELVENIDSGDLIF